jgi:hypothetical protein
MKITSNQEMKKEIEFDTMVASWAMGLVQYGKYHTEYLAIPEMDYDYDNEYTGLIWKISLREGYSLVVKAVYQEKPDGQPYMKADIISKPETVYRKSNNEITTTAIDCTQIIEVADSLLETFSGLVLASWWTRERYSLARIAAEHTDCPRGFRMGD